MRNGNPKKIEFLKLSYFSIAEKIPKDGSSLAASKKRKERAYGRKK